MSKKRKTKLDYVLVTIASGVDRENLFAEVQISNNQFAEVTVEEVEPQITIYARPNNEDWVFRYKRLRQIVSEIDAFLVSIGIDPPE